MVSAVRTLGLFNSVRVCPIAACRWGHVTNAGYFLALQGREEREGEVEPQVGQTEWTEHAIDKPHCFKTQRPIIHPEPCAVDQTDVLHPPIFAAKGDEEGGGRTYERGNTTAFYAEVFKEMALKSLVTRRNVSFWSLYAKISECVRYSPRWKFPAPFFLLANS